VAPGAHHTRNRVIHGEITLKLLVLGGPRFTGRHLVRAARDRGHEVTLFNRGRTEPELFPEVEKLHGDRAGDLSALAGRTWDACLDTSGFLPGVVRRSSELLRDHVGHYTFVSSISVFSDFSRAGMDEDAPVSALAPEQWQELDAIDASEPRNTPRFFELYGPLKLECERVVQEHFASHAAIVRPGLIVGPNDYMDRFPYWIARVAAGGEVLAPGRAQRPVQVIDARDLAEWMLRLAERGTAGVFNASGPAETLTMEAMLEACREAAGSDARFTWVDDAFLLEQKVGAWEEMPLWVPEASEHAGILQMDVHRAIAAGLTFRPLLQTARDTLSWERTRAQGERRAGLQRERERDLLEAWKQSTTAPGTRSLC
jgi:2'-hydroxyisoflavone reductase